MAMFESLTDRLSQSLKKISGKASLSEKNIQETLREVRMALLEADVALPVVKDFVEQVKVRAVGTEGQQQPKSWPAIPENCPGRAGKRDGGEK
jgi:signal recognition particle subunit SRP54